MLYWHQFGRLLDKILMNTYTYNKLNDTLNDNDFAFKESIFEREVIQHAKSYIQDLKDGKSDPTWPSSWGAKPTDPDYKHMELLKRFGFNPEDFADD